eukprot:TRINITY_DN65828_c0_g1_i1.p2 TRINITY_DN65828_c0_g1~~TRINITY_DN65828_c0_g1_i1.p2  ORF type:complete len:415 (+),score=105.66 TRINITY_DN65828_c0_g1_i1:80-1246(+)
MHRSRRRAAAQALARLLLSPRPALRQRRSCVAAAPEQAQSPPPGEGGGLARQRRAPQDPEPPEGQYATARTPILDKILPPLPRWEDPPPTKPREKYINESGANPQWRKNTYFSEVYDKYDLVPVRGKPRWYDLPDPNSRHLPFRYAPMRWETRLKQNILMWYMTGKLRRVGWLFALAGLAWLSNYLSRVTRVEVPEELSTLDLTGTAVCHQARFFLPDFKLFNVVAADRDSYCKRWTASVFSCAFFYPERRVMGLINPDYYARPYHLHYRRLVKEGEMFCTYRIEGRGRRYSILRSELTGAPVQCVAEVNDEGVLCLRLASALGPDCWVVRQKGTAFGDYVALPIATAVHSLWTRWWVTSSCNFFLRHHCSDVTVKPLDAATHHGLIV